MNQTMWRIYSSKTKLIACGNKIASTALGELMQYTSRALHFQTRGQLHTRAVASECSSHTTHVEHTGELKGVRISDQV